MNKKVMLVLQLVLLALAFWMGTLFTAFNQTGSVFSETVNQDVEEVALNNTAPAQMRNKNELTKQCASSFAAQENLDSTLTANEQALASMQQKLRQLSEILAQQQVTLNQQDSRYDRAVARLREAGIDIPQGISLEQASELLPEPFNKVIANAGAMMTDNFRDFQHQEQDYDWAIRMQQQVQDYFAMHEKGHLVQLNSVVCKANVCELRGFERQGGVWEVILKSMAVEGWWTPFSANNVSGNDSAQGNYFYLLARFSREASTLKTD